MNKRNVVILVAVVSIISIAATYLIISAMHTNDQRIQKTEVILQKETPPQATPAAAPQPAVDKDKVLALLNDKTESQRKKAIEAFKKVMRDVPPYVGTGTKGYPVALNGQYEKAIQISEEEIRDNPDIVGPRYMLAWVYARTGKYDRAITVCNDALQRGETFNSVRYILGWVYAKQGKYEDALKICDDALRVDPSSATLFYAKGRIQDLAGLNDEAIESYSKAISLKSDFYEPYVFLGLLYTELGRYEDAIKAQKQAINLNRYAPGGYLGLGIAYNEMGNYVGALDQLQKAVTYGVMGTDADSQTQPLVLSIGIDRAVIYNRIGILNLQLGSYQDALMAFNKAIAARQDFSDAYRGLILTYLLLNDKESARKTYDKLKNMDADLAKSIAVFMGE